MSIFTIISITCFVAAAFCFYKVRQIEKQKQKRIEQIFAEIDTILKRMLQQTR